MTNTKLADLIDQWRSTHRLDIDVRDALIEAVARLRVQPLEVDEFKRPVIYLASSSNYGGTVTTHCAFTARGEAVAWAKAEAAPYVDFSTWTAPQGQYPDETARDDEALTPTFIATWEGGHVHVEAISVATKYDWGAQSGQR